MDKMQEEVDVCFIIPCYRSENVIGSVVDGIVGVVEKISSYKIILVNDCSPDGTWAEIKLLCDGNPHIVGVNLSKNYGQQAARMAALPYVEGKYVVFMDDDGQHPVNGIIPMIEKVNAGYDIVYAHFKHKKDSKVKIWGSKVNAKMTELLIGKPKNIHPSSFFVVRGFVAQELKKYESPFPYLFGYFMQITKNIAEIELEHLPRMSGKTGYNLKKLVLLWLNGFTSFSVVPLRIATVIGMCTAFAGFVGGLYFFVRKLMGAEFLLGYASIMVTMLFLGGMVMMMLGLLGEYIGRMFITINCIPQYIIREVIGADSNDEQEQKK